MSLKWSEIKQKENKNEKKSYVVFQISERFKARRNVLSTECDAAKEREAYKTCEETDVKQNLKVSKRSKIVYCAIEKAGSTFWKRILYLIGENSNASNPTCINHTQADYGNNSFSDMLDKTWEEIEDIFKVSKTIMFVRNPYSRLFSAWLDKFYSPNVDYWNISGRIIAKHQRGNYEDKCTSDITFPEFVNHTADAIISTNQCVDRHFSPNYKHCNPCKLRFDYIGKYETMKDDTLFIIKALNLTNVVTFSDFEDDAANDAITDAADWAFYQKDKLTECGITFQCALFKVWQRLQSRGYISCKKSFPFLQGKVEINQEEFEALLKSAHSETSLEEAFSNRRESLSQALASLPENVLKKVQTAFGKDFDIFGYERDPKFGEYDAANANTYFKECPLTM